MGILDALKKFLGDPIVIFVVAGLTAAIGVLGIAKRKRVIIAKSLLFVAWLVASVYLFLLCYFKYLPWWSLMISLVFGLALIVLWLWVTTNGRSEDSPSAPVNSVSTAPQITATVTQNPVINVSVPPQEPKRAIVVLPDPDRPQPNVIVLTPRTALLRADDFHGTLHEGASDGFPVALACFRNDSVFGKKVSEARNLKAHMVYLGHDGAERFDIEHGCWLNSQYLTYTLSAGGSNCVAVIALIDGRYTAFWKEPFIDDETGWQGASLERRAIEEIAVVRVRLIDDFNRTLIDVKLDFSMISGKPQLEIRPSAS